MPGKVGVKIKAGRNLPVMDRGSDTTDAYVEIKFGNVTHKTDVCRKSLQPQWNTDWFRFEVDDAELQDEPLQIRLMDYDTYSANDAIGKVNISLNPLCLENLGQGKTVMSGWIPVFDTMHGIRGEVNIIVKVDLFLDANKFRQSSCGIQFFHSPCIPYGYRAQIIHGFVEELVVNDDPEYQWIDKIRTPRASNEARQVVFLRLSGQVQRKIGLKAINLGANAVIGYTQCFDLEGDVGVVARGIGTAVTLVKIQEMLNAPLIDNALIEEILGIDPMEKSLTKSPNIILKRKWRPAKENNVIIEENSSDTDCIKQFLQKEDLKQERTPKFRRQVKRLTTSSRNLLHEKINALKCRASEKKYFADKSLNSSCSDVSYSESLRNSLTDLRIRLKKRKMERSTSDGTGMASLLVNSIMHGPRLDLISEVHDSARSTPCRSLGSCKSKKSESLGNLSSESKNESFRNQTIHKNAQTSSASTVTLSSATTTEEAFSDDEEGSTTPPNEAIVIDADTVSMVVKSVLAQENLDSENWIEPGSTQDNYTRLETDSGYKKNSADSGGKFQISTGATRILKQRRNSEVTESKIVEMMKDPENLEYFFKSSMIKDSDSGDWIEPGSTANEPETIDKRRRGSLLGDWKDNIMDKFQQFQDHISQSNFPDDKIQKQSSITKTEENRSSKSGKSLKNLEQKKRNSLGTFSKKLMSQFSGGNKKNEQENKLVKKESIDCDTKPKKQNEQLFTIKLNISSFENDSLEKNRDTFEKLEDKALTETRNNEILILRDSPEDLIKGISLISNEVDPVSITASVEPFEENPATLALPEEIILALSGESTTSLEVPALDNYRNDISLLSSSAPTPDILLTNLQQQTILLETGSYYSSQPELNQSADSVAPKILGYGMPFLSLTNLSASSSSLCCPVANRTNNSPSTSPSTPIDPSIQSNAVQRPSCLSSNVKNCLDNARSNILSSSYTNLSTTNKAPMLASSPYLKHCRSEMPTAHPASPGSGKTGHIRAESVGCKIPQSPAKVTNSTSISSSVQAKDKEKDLAIYRRSSDSDLSVTPKGNSICVASERLISATNMMRLSGTLKPPNQENIDMMEYPFLTLAKYPLGFILHIGATVTARSVKLLERVPNPDEPEIRDSWWTEIRMEIRSHARSLGCNVILGYSEVTTISDDVCVLSATGTAATINMQYNGDAGQIELISSSKKDLAVSSLDDKDCFKDLQTSIKEVEENSTIPKELSSSLSGSMKVNSIPSAHPVNFGCSICHIPYSKSSAPFSIKMKKCSLCKRGKVPDVLLATIEIPEALQITGRGCFLQAQVVRAKKDLRAESNAKEISDGLPFLEYELHRVLINKLKAKGMNAIFGLKAQISIGERMMALIATGTGVFLSALPAPKVPRIVAGNSWTDTAKLNDIQKSLQETFERNREIYQLKIFDMELPTGKQSDTDDSDDEIGELDLNTGSKDTCVLEIDDIEDLEIISLLMEPCPPDGFHVVNTQTVPGLEDMEVVKNLQMFSQVWRAKISMGQTSIFPKHFQRLLQTIFFKLRCMIPCAICDLKFRLDLPESDEIQLLVTGMALGLGEPSKLGKLRLKNSTGNSRPDGDGKKIQLDDELIFSLDEDQNLETNQKTPTNINYGSHSLKMRKTSPQRTKFNSVKFSRHMPLRERYGVDITPLCYVPGGKIEKYLGNLNFFFIRESTSIRENGGISGFVHSFITELLAVVRAHISALGGNAMVSFYMTELILVDNQHKNQGQCLVSIGGDVVYVSYFTDD